MNYSDFKQKVLNRLVEQIDNPNPGSWRGKGCYRHIIGNPKSNSQEQIDYINKYMLLPNVPKIEQNIHLHQNAHHLNSSQIMCYNFFRPLINDFDNRTKMYKPTDKLVDLISSLIDTPIEKRGSLCAFEYIPKGNEHTNFDFYFKNGRIEVFFEIKYTEAEFSKRSSSKEPHIQYVEIYKKLIEECEGIFTEGGINEDDFNGKYYQLARNSIRVTSNDKHVFFVCPKAHEDLIKQFVIFSQSCLTDYARGLIQLVTWEELLSCAEDNNIETTDFRNRYLSFLK